MESRPAKPRSASVAGRRDSEGGGKPTRDLSLSRIRFSAFHGPPDFHRSAAPIPHGKPGTTSVYEVAIVEIDVVGAGLGIEGLPSKTSGAVRVLLLTEGGAGKTGGDEKADQNETVLQESSFHELANGYLTPGRSVWGAMI